MPVYQITWSSLLNLTELQFKPEAPKQLRMTDEMIQTIAWLTGATPHDRRLLRCDDNGALLTADAWSNLVSVETDALVTAPPSSDSYTATVANKGLLLAVTGSTVLATFTRVSGGSTEAIYITKDWLYWYPHPTYSVSVVSIGGAGGDAANVGVTAFN